MENKIIFPSFVSFITSPAGRGLRVLAGVSLLVAGYQKKGRAGTIMACAGLLPLMAGAFDICVLGRLLGGFYQGDAMRQALHRQQGFPQLESKPASFMWA